jgi:hypothetical protein
MRKVYFLKGVRTYDTPFIYEKLDLFNVSSILLLYSEELRAELIKIELSLYTKKLIILGQKELKLISKK